MQSQTWITRLISVAQKVRISANHSGSQIHDTKVYQVCQATPCSVNETSNSAGISSLSSLTSLSESKSPEHVFAGGIPSVSDSTHFELQQWMCCPSKDHAVSLLSGPTGRYLCLLWFSFTCKAKAVYIYVEHTYINNLYACLVKHQTSSSPRVHCHRAQSSRRPPRPACFLPLSTSGWTLP